VWGTPSSSKFIEANGYVPEITNANYGSCSSSTYAGNPINTTNGNKYRQENDFTATGLSPLNITRYYSSNKNKRTTVGINWRHSYTALLTANIHTESVPYIGGDSNFSSLQSTAQLACESGWNDIKATYNKPVLANSTAVYLNNNCSIQDANGSALGTIAVRDDSSGGISPNPPQDTVVIERANGNAIIFTLVNSTWTAPTDADVSLVQTTSGYTLTTAQDTVEQYNLSGQLVSTLSRTGMQQNLAYNATTGLLESVTDSLGNALGFAYTGTQLTTVTLPDATQLVYSYDGNNNFSSVKREDNTVKTYIYENTSFPNALTGIIDENNQRYMTFSYDALGRAVTSELAGGVEKVIVNFVDDTSSTVTDALGEVRTYRFTTINGEKKLSALEGSPCSSCGGNNALYTYDANGYVNSKTDFNGVQTTYINNARGLATSVTEAVATPSERTTLYAWHSTYALPTCIIGTQRTRHFVYSTNGLLESRTAIDTSDAVNFDTAASKTCDAILARSDYASLNKRTTSNTYYPEFGLLKSVDGPRTDVNDITNFVYDTAGNLSTITNALGHVTELKNYTLRGKPQTLIDANGLITTITYDVRGRVDLVTVGSQLTNYDFDAVGNLDRVTRPDGSLIDYDYDAAHRLTDIRDQLGNHIQYVLDALGNRTKTDVKDSAGTLKRTQTAVYNQLSQLEKTIGAATQTTDYLLYDHNGNLKQVRDPEGNVTVLGYDALNRLETTTNALLKSSTTKYDAQNNVISITDLRGLETTYQYDGLGSRTQQTSPDTGITQYIAHDSAGNVLSMLDAKNQTTTYQYDVLNRIGLVTYDDGTQTDYLYDQGINAAGKLSSIEYTNTSGAGSSVWVYDVHGRITSKTELVNTLALTTLYTYQATTGLLDSMQTTGGHVVSYAYLNAQLNSISVDGNILLKDITFDPFGAVNAWTWGNGLASSRTYDQDGQLSTYTLGNSLYDINYTLSGNVQDITNLNIASTQQTFNYDALHRIKDYASSIGSEAYDYDASSNRIALTNLSTTQTSLYAIDTASNRLLNISGVSNVSYIYDANGNTTNDGVHSFGYDARNRLIDVDAGDIKYQLNALGQRVQKTLAPIGNINGDDVFGRSDINALRTYIRKGGVYLASYDCNKDGILDRDDLKCLRELIQYQRQNPDAPIDNGITLYVYNEQGQLVAEHTDTGIVKQEVLYLGSLPIAVLKLNQVYYIHTDHLGTPRMITNTTNTPIWTWMSDPFGTTAANDDPDGDGVNFVFNHRFAGQYYDWETGLHYNYFRDYDPSTGRYVQSDPIGLAGGLNTYGYVGGNPLYYVDSYGLAEYSPSRITKSFNRNDTRGGFSDNGTSLVFNPDFYNPSRAAEILITGVSFAATGGIAGISGKGIQQCAKKLANNKNLCKNSALAALLGLSVCQQGKLQGTARRFVTHRETVTTIVKPLPKLRRPPFVIPK
jgi:RHS repeat-associated protein